MTDPCKSAVYEGWVSHSRLLPKQHGFRYRLFMLYLDLDEVPQVFDPVSGWSAKRFAPAWFRRGDYLNPSEPDLKKAVSNLVCEKIGHRPIDRICLLTQIRCLGFVFNPVSIYYCFGTNGLEAIVAEVTNTPWGERHAYVLDCRQQLETDWFLFGKAFHVSPFMPMKIVYKWKFKAPGSQLMVRMENLQSGARLFQANLDLNRRPLTAKVLRRMWWRHPLMPHRILVAIYYQAVRLWLKRIPLYLHPKKRTQYDPEVDHDSIHS